MPGKKRVVNAKRDDAAKWVRAAKSLRRLLLRTSDLAPGGAEKARVLTSLAEGRRVERLSKSGGFLVPIGDLAFQISDVLGDGGFDLDGFALAGRARSAIIAK